MTCNRGKRVVGAQGVVHQATVERLHVEAHPLFRQLPLLATHLVQRAGKLCATSMVPHAEYADPCAQRLKAGNLLQVLRVAFFMPLLRLDMKRAPRLRLFPSESAG